MKATINIGLARTGTYPLTPREALTALYAASFPDHDDLTKRLFRIERYGMAQSATEPTLVVEIETYAQTEDALYKLACELSQDCIAIRPTAGGTGFLFGPRAAAWGEFNPDYFLTLP